MSEPRDIGEEFTKVTRRAFWRRPLRIFCESCDDEELKRIMDWADEIKALNLSRPAYHEVVAKVIEERRHKELARPRWTETPGFWVSVASMIMTLVFGIIGYLAWKHPVEPLGDSHAQPASQEQPSYQLSPSPSMMQPGSAPTNSVGAPVSPKK